MVQSSYLKMTLVLFLLVGLSYNAECAKRKKLNVTVLDKETKVVIHKAQVTVITLSNGSEIEKDTKNTGKDGQCKFSLKIDQSYQYKVYASKSGYIQCVNDSGDNKIISEVLITDYEDEDLILYLTLEPKKSIAKPTEQATEPKTTETVENKIQQTDHSPVISQNEPQKPIKQEIRKEEQSATGSDVETAPSGNSKEKEKNSWVGLIVIGILGLIIYISKKKFSGRSGASAPSSNKTISKPIFSNKIKIKPLYWFQCKNCRLLIKQDSNPRRQNCTKKTYHSWSKLAEVGDTNYYCQRCDTKIQAKSSPLKHNCPDATYHSWTKL